jgi:hypothetical protein
MPNHERISVDHIFGDSQTSLTWAKRLKVRLAVEILMSAPDANLTDDLVVSLDIYRDIMDIQDLMFLQEEHGHAFPLAEMLADIIRRKIDGGIFPRGMELSAASVAGTYDVPEGTARDALAILAEASVLARRPAGNTAGSLMVA